jgi:hypothetical protein
MCDFNDETSKASIKKFQKNNSMFVESIVVKEETIERIKKEIEKLLEKHYGFMGSYGCHAKDGKISFPWKQCLKGKKPWWFMVRSEENGIEKKTFVVSYDEIYLLNSGLTFAAKGKCKFSENGELLIHKKVQDCICERSVWLGSRCFAELLSEEEYNAICDTVSIDKLSEILEGDKND